MVFRYLIGLTLLLSSLTNAATRPEVPAPGEDKKLFKGETAAQFFAKREANTICRRELDARRKAFTESRVQLQKLLTAKAPAAEIDAQENTMETLRTSLLETMETCGECATLPMETVKVPAPLKTEYWYITDGSCFLPGGLTAEQKNKAYETAKALLLHTGKYSRQDGGYPSVVEFFGVDANTGNKLPKGVVNSPYKAFIAVRGPFDRAFNYVMDGTYEEKTKGDLKEFVLLFTAGKSPEAWQKEIFYHHASGKKTPMSPQTLNAVKGMWYVNNQGYMRYYTTADFGSMMGMFLGGFARTTLMSTLHHMSERSQQ